MPAGDPAVRGSVRHDQPACDDEWLPPTCCDDRRRQTSVAIRLADHSLDIGDARLQLDHQQRPRCRVLGEDVDDGSFAVDGERDLRDDLPSIACGKEARHRLVELRVARVQQAIELASTSASHQVDPDLQDGRDATKLADRHELKVTALDQ